MKSRPRQTAAPTAARETFTYLCVCARVCHNGQKTPASWKFAKVECDVTIFTNLKLSFLVVGVFLHIYIFFFIIICWFAVVYCCCFFGFFFVFGGGTGGVKSWVSGRAEPCVTLGWVPHCKLMVPLIGWFTELSASRTYVWLLFPIPLTCDLPVVEFCRTALKRFPAGEMWRELLFFPLNSEKIIQIRSCGLVGIGALNIFQQNCNGSCLKGWNVLPAQTGGGLNPADSHDALAHSISFKGSLFSVTCTDEQPHHHGLLRLIG